MNRRRASLAILGASMLPFGSGRAQSFPTRPIRLIVPFSAGGAGDMVGRALSVALQSKLPVTVIVENRPGASTTIGTAAGLRSSPDGYTLVAAPPDGLTIVPTIRQDLPYNVERDMQPIALVADLPMAIAVSAKLPFKTLADLVSAAKAKPGEIRYGTVGHASAVHMASELFALETGTSFLHVPYKGGSEIVTGVLSDQVDMIVASISLLKPVVDSGRMRALAVASPERSSALPDVPTTAECGYPEVIASTWIGVVGPTGIPDPVLKVLTDATMAAARDPGFVKQVETLGGRATVLNQSEFSRMIRADAARWRRVAEKVNLKG